MSETPMTEGGDAKAYRRSASKVRAEARAHLLALRRERQGKRGPVSGEPRQPLRPERTPATPPMTVSAAARRVVEDTYGLSSTAQVHEEDPAEIAPDRGGPANFDSGSDGPETANVDVPPACAAQEPDEAVDFESGDQPEALPHPFPESEFAAEHLASEPSFAEVPPDLSLSRLPGAGPGLVWLLQRAGVKDLGDLARADADELGRRLGIVGELLDMSSWIGTAVALTRGR